MKVNTPSTIISYITKSISHLNIVSQSFSHWVALRLLNVTRLESSTWKWQGRTNMDAKLEEKELLVVFHPEFSSGTEMVMGDTDFRRGNIYFWEIELMSPVYGTDMMLGIATTDINVNQYQYVFRGPLGENDKSWGISYHGYCQSEGVRTKLLKMLYPSRFGDGTKFGFHLDTWHGLVDLYINGSFTGTIWKSEKFTSRLTRPILTSTAARTRMKLLYSTESKFSLKYLALKAVSKEYSIKELMGICKIRHLSMSVFIDYFWLFH